MVDKASFGTARKLRIATQVALTVSIAIVIWLLLNFITTRPRLRTSLDLSRGARFTISDATKEMIAELRERDAVLEVDTYFQDPKDSAFRNPRTGRLGAVSRMQRRCIDLTRNLLRRLDYFGGDHVRVVHHNIYTEITARSAQAKGLDASIVNAVRMKIGPRQRSLDLLRDMADIEVPQGQPHQPGQIAEPILRDYQGEEAFATALYGLLQERKLIAYWLSGHGEAPPTGASAGAASLLAREMVARQGFENRVLDLSQVASVPEDCSLLMILGPVLRPIGGIEAGKIQRYIRGGGRVLMTVHVALEAGRQKSFRRLIGRYGLSLGEGWLWNGIKDSSAADTYTFGDPQCARIVIRRLNAEHPATGRLRQQGGFVELHRARSLAIGKPTIKGAVVDPILTTNPKAWQHAVPAPGERPDLSYPDAEALGTRHVGASIEVTPAGGERPGRMIVISGMLLRNGGDPFVGGRLAEANLLFGTYLVNWLVRDTSLVPVESPHYRARTMDVSPPQLARVKLWLVWVLPGAFLFLSFFVLFWRRRA